MASSAERRFAIGVDYGTNSVRALVVDVADGAEVATYVYNYPSGEAGILLDPKDPNLARQNPADYIEGFYVSVKRAVDAAEERRRASARRTWSASASTRPARRRCRWIAGHAAGDAAGVSEEPGGPCLAVEGPHGPRRGGRDHGQGGRSTQDHYLAKCGGTYSSEWYWSKILHCKRTAPKVFAAAYAWVELADFVPAFITGNIEPAHPAARHLRGRPQGDVQRPVGRAAQRAFLARSTRPWSSSPSVMPTEPCRPTRRRAN